MAELRAQAADRGKPASKAGPALVVAVWLAALALSAWLLWPERRGS
jgi:hypothetical protein